ncbi:MAG: hypothetical protein Q9162_002566 [Coniocarpon cinnabarinum]
MAEEEHIVAIEGGHVEIPKFDIPHKYTEFVHSKPHEIPGRIKDATIVITITVREVTPEMCEQASRLKMLLIMGTGTGWAQRDYFAKRGIMVCNTPNCNLDSCSGHALGLYFAARRRLYHFQNLATKTTKWADDGQLVTSWEGGQPLSHNQETVGIVGYGPLGQAIEKICRSVGMGEVVIAERKGATQDSIRPGREAFEGLLERVTVLFLCCPKDPSTINLIDMPELKKMRKEAILINMARGGIVNESSLAQSLKQRMIYGAATDVFEVEPAKPGSSPLLPIGEEIPNLTISPHTSWIAQKTLENLKVSLKETVACFFKGQPINVVVDPTR